MTTGQSRTIFENKGGLESMSEKGNPRDTESWSISKIAQDLSKLYEGFDSGSGTNVSGVD